MALIYCPSCNVEVPREALCEKPAAHVQGSAYLIRCQECCALCQAQAVDEMPGQVIYPWRGIKSPARTRRHQ